MKKTAFLLLSSCLAGCLSAYAESCLVLQMRDGNTHSYILSQQPTMSFGDGTLTMKSTDAEATFSLTDIENFHFADSENSIREVNADDRCFSYVNGVIMVEDTQCQVVLTDVAGRVLHATHGGETFSFDLNDQPQGTYLMRIGQQSVKLYHR